MKKYLSIVLLLVIFWPLGAKTSELVSPGGKVKAVIESDRDQGILATVYYADYHVFTLGPIQMDVEQKGLLGERSKWRKEIRTSVNESFDPVVHEKRQLVHNQYAGLSVWFKEGFRIDFRAYDDGFAYRFYTEFPGEIQVNSENFALSTPDSSNIYFPEEESFFSHNEREYFYRSISGIGSDEFASLPALIENQQGVKILLTESHLEDYPGLYICGSEDHTSTVKGIFPHYVTEEKLIRDRDMKPIQRADYVAKTTGTRTFPWRVMAIEKDDKDLMSNDIVLRLAPECRIDETDWIKPGKVAWDWWNASNNHGVDFTSGVNTATYKYTIDFAAKYGLEYIILDEGWSVPGDLFQINPDCDMEEITSYAHEKEVGIILWVLWNALDQDLEPALDQFVEWGVKGIKVDFMQRDDQQMVNYYWKVAKAAAARQLLVDFHGSYKPSGIRRAYPNCVNREGLKGLENVKWSSLITPDHDCTLPFIRMVAGPMDYTPGAMRNASKTDYHISFNRPMSMGTRCHQLGLYVIFDSPLQMLADAPSHYLEEPLAMEFLSAVPSVWDETVPLFGKVGDFAVTARKSGNDWFIGGITDWTSRDFEIDMSFLDGGAYELIEFVDGKNVDRYAEDFAKRIIHVDRSTKHSIHLASGGGYAAILRKL